MPLAPSAPYDSLATVTSQVRTLLGDYIQGINPNVSGTVNTNGLVVSWVSGNKFTYVLNNTPIVINGVTYLVAPNGVTSATTLNLVASAGVQAGVNYSAVLPTGDIFSDAQAYVLPTVNLAWRKMQEKLEHSSHPRTRNETVLLSLPVAGSSDPATQQWINWTNFFDGVNLFSPAAPPASGPCPVLPQDFMSPLELWERQSVGVNVVNPLGFKPMALTIGRLPARVKGSWNGIFDWREDAIYLPGAILPLDVRVSYRAFLPDIAVAAGGFSVTPVPIMRCSDALACYSAGIFVTPRGASEVAAEFMAAGDTAVDVMTNRQGKMLQFANVRRRAVYVSNRGNRGGW